MKKNDTHKNDFRYYFLLKNLPMYGFCCAEDPHSKSKVEFHTYIESTKGKFLKSNFFNILDFEIGRIEIQVKDNYVDIYNGKYSVEIWKNLYSHQYGYTFKNLIAVYKGASFSSAKFISSLFFLDIFLRYNLIGFQNIKFRYFETFEYFAPLSNNTIYELVKKLEIKSKSTTISRIGKDNKFITKNYIENLPSNLQVKTLIILYYETFKGYNYEAGLSETFYHYAYSPEEADTISLISLSEYEIANVYKYIVEHYNHELDRVKFYEDKILQIIEKMKLKIEINQIWGTELERFKVIHVLDDDITLCGLTDVNFLNLKQNENCFLKNQY